MYLVGAGIGVIIGILLVYVLSGALIGFIASKIMDSDNSTFVSNAILGIIGSVAGGFVGNLFHVHNTIISFIIAVVCSCLLIFIVRKINNKN